MGAHELSVVVEGMTFVESPRWHEGRLWFSDFYTQRVMAVVPGEEPEEIVTVAGQPSGLGLAARRPDGDRVDDAIAACCDTSRPASSSSTPIWAAWRPGTSTTWWSVRMARRTSATSASI